MGTPSIQLQLWEISSDQIFVGRSLASRCPCNINEKLTAFMYANAIDAHNDGDDDDNDNMSNKWL